MLFRRRFDINVVTTSNQRDKLAWLRCEEGNDKWDRLY